MTACGGGNNNSSDINGKVLSVTASCNPTTIQGGQTSQCTAVVNATGKAEYNQAVNWSASAGSLNYAGLFTAPHTDASLQITITAVSTGDPSKVATTIVTVNPPNVGSNMVPLIVDGGPTNNYVNGAFASVTLCVPGTTNCQTIDHLLVDTGSSGVRVIDSVLTLSLPQQTSNGGVRGECAQFPDGVAWGEVASADIQVGGEKATSVPGANFTGIPVQVIGTSVFPVPQSCSARGVPKETVQALGANGILGVGLFQQDCGTYCTSNIDPNFPFYYACSGGTCAQAVISLTNQVQNPVWVLPQDNNGVLIALPDCEGCGQLNGFLMLGIDTQGDNFLGDANFYATTPDGNFQKVTLNGRDYVNDCGVSDNPVCLSITSGSNALFLLDAQTLGVSQCSGTNAGFYCQNPAKYLQPVNVGVNGTSNSVLLSIGDADLLLSGNSKVPAFSTLAGPNPGSFEYGLPFFMGRPVFIVIESKTTSKERGRHGRTSVQYGLT